METSRQLQFLFQDCDYQVRADGNPHLCLDGVGRIAEKALDPQILFDPLEEQFHLPAAFVKQCNRGGREREAVGQIDEESIGLGVEITDASQPTRIAFLAVENLQPDDLIGADASVGFYWQRAHPRVLEAALGTNDEESADLLDTEAPEERLEVFEDFLENLKIDEDPDDEDNGKPKKKKK